MGRVMILVAALMSIPVLSTRAQDWDEVRGVLDREGDVEDGILRFDYPRTDLDVSLDGVPVSADLALTSWYSFWPMPDGTVMLMGDTVVREDELAGVLEEAQRQGLEVMAIHNHLVLERSRIMYTHMSGQGDAGELARKVKAILEQTDTPMEEPVEEEPADVDWSSVIAILGEPAERKGDLIEYAFQRAEQLRIMGMEMPSTEALETAPEVKLEMLSDGRAVAYGEMVLINDEVDPVFDAFTEHNFAVMALHNHMIFEQPRLFFMHWWSVGEPEALARGIRAAIDEMNVRTE